MQRNVADVKEIVTSTLNNGDEKIDPVSNKIENTINKIVLDNTSKPDHKVTITKSISESKTAIENISSYEYSLIIASLSKIDQIYNKFPLAEFKTLASINSDTDHNQVETDIQGKLIVTEKNIFRKIFNFPRIPPLSLIKTYITTAETTLNLLQNVWPNTCLLNNFPKQVKQRLKHNFASLYHLILGALTGITILEKDHLNDNMIISQIAAIKETILGLGNIVIEFRDKIFVEPAISMIANLNDIDKLIDYRMHDSINDERGIKFSFELIAILQLLDDILNVCRKFPEQSTFIEKETIRIKNKLNLKLKIEDYEEYLRHAENLLEIGNFEDLQVAKELCEIVRDISPFFKEGDSFKLEANYFLSLIYIRKINILPKLYNTDVNELQEDEIYRVREIALKKTLTDLPKDVLNEMGSYLTPAIEKKNDIQRILNLSFINKSFHSLFQPRVNLFQFLQAVAYGDKIKVKTILERSSPESRRYLLVTPGKVTDFVGRKLEMTALQLTLYAVDVGRPNNQNEGMAKMILAFLKELDKGREIICFQIKQQFPTDWEEIKKQQIQKDTGALNDIFTAIRENKENYDNSLETFRNYFELKYKEVIHCNVDTTAEMLATAYKLFTENYVPFGHAESEKNKKAWRILGIVQRHSTVSYAYILCYGILKSSSSSEIPRSLQFSNWNEDGFLFPLTPNSGIGFQTATMGGICLINPPILSTWTCPRYLSGIIASKNSMLNSILVIYQSPKAKPAFEEEPSSPAHRPR